MKSLGRRLNERETACVPLCRRCGVNEEPQERILEAVEHIVAKARAGT